MFIAVHHTFHKQQSSASVCTLNYHTETFMLSADFIIFTYYHTIPMNDLLLVL